MFFKLFSSFSLIFSLLILLRRLLTYFRLQLDEFFSDFIVASLPEDSKNSPSSLILWNALKQRQPSRARSLKLLKLNLVLKFSNKHKSLLDQLCLSAEVQQHQRVDLHVQSNNHERKCEARKSPIAPLMLY